MDFQRGHRHQQQPQMTGGLTRYRSAPSSYFTSFLDATDNYVSSSVGGGGGGIGGMGGYVMDDLDQFLNRFMPNNSGQRQEELNPGNNFSNSMSIQSHQTQFVGSMKQEQESMESQGQLNDFSSQMMYQSQDSAEIQAPAQRNQQNSEASVDYSNRLLNSVNTNRFTPMKMATGGGNSNLIRYNSSPAGLFANINIENEYGAMRGMGNFGAGNNANAEASFSSTSRFEGFSSGQSSSGLMPPISEMGTKGMGDQGTSFEGQRNDGGGNYITGFPVSSWDDSGMLSENLGKGLVGDNNNQQGNEGQKDPAPTLLSRHLSLPSTSVEFSAMDTLMQDSVLCKIRAKRGCATHPRSIAERVRRTRISERMRKLQEAVPNMDKQTNTSDMLDLAVDYIKDLQKQLKTLLDNRAKCTCSHE